MALKNIKQLLVFLIDLELKAIHIIYIQLSILFTIKFQVEMEILFAMLVLER